MKTTDVKSVASDVCRRYLQLQLTMDVGPIRLRNLVRHFGSLEAVLSASPAELERVERIGPKVADAIVRSRTDDLVDSEVARAAECGLRIICSEDDDYPKPLLNIPDPPICLSVSGTLEPADSVAVAIVGTRRCSHYGREQALRFGESLAATGFTVVSGLARGIDGLAHRGALQGGGRTIAVLGNGLSSIYPQEHTELASDVAGAGAVISEMPVNGAPKAQNFPRRNRIIAGLSLGVIVVEAGKRSGALITARLASEYNREVFAVPGRIDQPEYSTGANGLIRDGHAKLITCLDDVLDELAEVGDAMRSDAAADSKCDGGVDNGASTIPQLAGEEEEVFGAIRAGADNVESIGAATALDSARVTSMLTSLQLKGLIRQVPGNRFDLRRR